MCPHHNYLQHEDVHWDNCNNHGERVHLTNRTTTRRVHANKNSFTFKNKSAHKDTYTSCEGPFSEGSEQQENVDCKSCDINRKSENSNNNDYLFNVIYELLLANENCTGNELVHGTHSLAAYHISRTLYKYLLFFKSPILLPLGAHCTELAKCTRRTIVINYTI